MRCLERDEARRPALRADVRGVTLIESLVAVVIVGLTASAIGGLLTHQIRQSASNEMATIAYGLAAQELESMRGTNFTAMSTGSREATFGGSTFTVRTVVAEGVPAANMKKITVAVSWSDPEGTKDVEVSTIYTSVQRG